MHTNSNSPTDTRHQQSSYNLVTTNAGPEAARIEAAEEPLDLIFKRVERAKQEWEATVDALPDLICLLDAHGCIVRANRTVEAWELGHVTDVPQRPFHQVIHPGCEDLFCNIRRFVDSAVRTATPLQPSELEVFDARLNRCLKLRARPVAAQGSVGADTVVVISDISEARQNQESLQRYAGRLEAMNAIQGAILAAHSPEEIAQAALSHLQVLVPFSLASIRLYEVGADEYFVLDAHANGLVQVEPGRRQPAALFTSRSLKRSIGHYVSVADLAVLNDPSDNERELRQAGLRSYVSFPMVAEGQFIGALCLASNRVNAFHQEHLEIAHEVADLLTIATCQAQLYRQVQQANQQLAAALQVRDEVLQNVSHELRTPLNLIYGYTSLLEDALLGDVTAEQARALRIMHKQEDRLRFMVDRLVLLRMFDPQHMQRVPLDMSGWLSQVLDTWLPRAVEAQIALIADLPPALPTINAAPDYLRQVIDNLLDNALKFSPPHSTVQVQAWLEANELILSIADQGAGIPLDKIKQVFERFYQVDGSATRRYGGMGVGLGLCQEIIAAHGGRIWVTSAGENQGSTFFMALPAAVS